MVWYTYNNSNDDIVRRHIVQSIKLAARPPSFLGLNFKGQKALQSDQI